MRVGLGRLRLDPAAFWRMTPIEFAAACTTTEYSGQVPGRGDLAALMQRYPDGGER